MDLVSVVIPVYNDEKTVSRAVESALNQSYNNIEIIVVDDNSSDNSVAIANSYTDVKLVQNEVNKGGAAARNIGLYHANGKYIAFLDADDEWKTQKTEQQINAIESTRSGAALCDFKLSRRKSLFFKNYVVDGSDRTYSPTVRNLLTKEFQPGGASSIVVKSAIMKEIGGFDEEFERHQDWEFLIRLVKETHICYVNKKLFVKYASKKPSADSVKQSKEKFLEKFEDDVEENIANKTEFYEDHEFTLARLYLRELNFEEGLIHLYRSSLSTQHIFVALYSVFAGGILFLVSKISKLN